MSAHGHRLFTVEYAEPGQTTTKRAVCTCSFATQWDHGCDGMVDQWGDHIGVEATRYVVDAVAASLKGVHT